jgi:hypothetical protein
MTRRRVPKPPPPPPPPNTAWLWPVVYLGAGVDALLGRWAESFKVI